MRPLVLLDVDGTLVDSNDLHAMAWVDALRDQRFEADFAAVRPLIGMGGDKLLPCLTGVEADSPEGKRISAHRGEIFTERYLPRARAFRGTRALLETLRRTGFDLHVASSAQREELERLLQQAELADLLPNRTSSEDVAKSKPDPDILLVALQRAKHTPAGAWMLGDTPYDAEAAQRAGVAFVGVLSGGHTREALRPAEAVYRDPEELLAHLGDSPLANLRS
jgi:phosphoglycolate phosphatase-like HAD superfamily hydrolase